MKLMPSLLLLASLPLHATPVTIDQQARTELSATLYQDGQALIREQRTLPDYQNADTIFISDLPETLQLQSLQVEGLSHQWRRFRPAQNNLNSLVESHIGQPISIIDDERDGLTRTVTPLKLNGGQLLVRNEEGGIENLPLHGRWRFQFPADSQQQRTAQLGLLASGNGKASKALTLSYLAGGFSWANDYVALLKRGADMMNLEAWVTLINNSGFDLPPSQLQLLAGQPNRATSPAPHAERAIMMEAKSAAMPEQQSIGSSYHLYTLPNQLALPSGEKRQALLLRHSKIPIERHYYRRTNAIAYNSGLVEQLKARVALRFDNDKPAVGEPLPAGTFHIYEEDNQGRTQLLGEDRIEHTTKGARVELDIGESFDIDIERVQLQYQHIDNRRQRLEWSITVHNGSDKPVSVELDEQFRGLQWQVESHTHTFSKPDGVTLRFTPQVAPGESDTIRYGVLLTR